MKLVILYGPPGVGKLTIAQELSNVVNLPIFHNHASADLLSGVFTEREQRNIILNKIRFDIFEYAAKVNVPGLIFTFVYRSGEHDEYFQKIVETVNSYGGSVKFVQLTCSDEELFKRVQSEERKKHQKITDVEKLKNFMQEHKLTESFNGAEEICVDVSNISPIEAANKIAELLG